MDFGNLSPLKNYRKSIVSGIIMTLAIGAVVSSTPILAADDKDRLPECTSPIVRNAAGEAVEVAYSRLGMGKAAIASKFSAHIRQTLTAYNGSDLVVEEKSAARSVGLRREDIRFCVTDEIAKMKIIVWVASNQKDKNQWHAVVTNFGMGSEAVAVSPPMPK